jgi:hypothetical protein
MLSTWVARIAFYRTSEATAAFFASRLAGELGHAEDRQSLESGRQGLD